MILIFKFSSKITHEVAIDSMDILAKLLNDKLDFTKIAYSLEEIEKFQIRVIFLF